MALAYYELRYIRRKTGESDHANNALNPSAAHWPPAQTADEVQGSEGHIMSAGFAIRRAEACAASEMDCGVTDKPYRACCPESSSCPAQYNIDVRTLPPSWITLFLPTPF